MSLKSASHHSKTPFEQNQRPAKNFQLISSLPASEKFSWKSGEVVGAQILLNHQAIYTKVTWYTQI